MLPRTRLWLEELIQSLPSADSEASTSTLIGVQFLSILPGLFLRFRLHPRLLSSAVLKRKLFTIFTGFLIAFFCFGRSTIIILTEIAIVFLLVKLVPVKRLPESSLVLCLTIQLFVYVKSKAEITFRSIGLNFSMMMVTQRLTSLCFSLRDGMKGTWTTSRQQRNSLSAYPDFTSYLAYAVDFHTLLGGPLIAFKDFNSVLEGEHLRRMRPRERFDTCHYAGEVRLVESEVPQTSTTARYPMRIEEPSCLPYLRRALVTSVFCGISFIILSHVFPLDVVFTEAFCSYNILFKMTYLVLLGHIYKLQLYSTWALSEAVCLSSDLGCDYRSEGAVEVGNGAKNAYIMDCEMSPSFMESLNFWNVRTRMWIEDVVIQREGDAYSLIGVAVHFARRFGFMSEAVPVSSSPTQVQKENATNFLNGLLLLCLVQGFRPGIFASVFTSATIAVVLSSCSEILRQTHIRISCPRTSYIANPWKFLCFVSTKVLWSYTFLPFVVLSWDKTLHIWSEFMFVPHLLSFVGAFRFLTLDTPTRDTGTNQEVHWSIPRKTFGVATPKRESGNKPRVHGVAVPFGTFGFGEPIRDVNTNRLRYCGDVVHREIPLTVLGYNTGIRDQHMNRPVQRAVPLITLGFNAPPIRDDVTNRKVRRELPLRSLGLHEKKYMDNEVQKVDRHSELLNPGEHEIRERYGPSAVPIWICGNLVVNCAPRVKVMTSLLEK